MNIKLAYFRTCTGSSKIEAARPDINAWTKVERHKPFLMNYLPILVQRVSHRLSAVNKQPLIVRGEAIAPTKYVCTGRLSAPDFDAIARMTSLEAVEEAVFTSKKYFTGQQDNLAKTYAGMFPDFRLPSEDEWEFAAYARKSTDAEGKIRAYPWAAKYQGKLNQQQQQQQKAHYNKTGADIHSNVFSRTVPVGSFAPNDFGLYNMQGT